MPDQDKSIKRSKEILTSYFVFLDQHIDDVVQGRVPEFMELNQIARELAVSHQHLSDTIQLETGHHPCHFYDEKIIDQAKKLLKETKASIAQVAMQLTYDPSNFSKFFKKWTGQTPGNFRKSISG
ncbi:AraC family transcriptional regulator [Elizabethkingia sp. HX WHF]|uniref:helix-turn-helix domain-containing protein n=1 Tax=Elizabethkingia TaxID=308865 RepID=UPI0005D9C83D|nr:MULTISPECIES: AraC family transcriptional regulator [Elizabethkingia]AJW61857.1 HTH-type transcriptional activator Btr [Elizabethkingia miricola]ATL42937.1 AraC family transcriptional regulator [Elizabethkingia miricola]MCL1637504.1 AraC family transcriptional regulator [Elizabethkingia bruuniana]MDX8563194.1 AraC family transcriptional regulator [Elizabethkingia sp. HX WHF]OPC19739.1 DNA-binding protein [Elizabethkingia bruuniana]